ncbi:hypothetical protein [Spirillospora sp. NPDC047279]|uniref:hypothetical protein n=1 Tax=Spirillospora sp. NPDC047279 TaxID=3155478 RepID=UPI0033E62F87
MRILDRPGRPGRPGLTGRTGLVAVVAALILVIATAAVLALGRDDDPEASPGMRGRAQSVMPFDLSATTHTFTKTATGGVQRVVAHDRGDDRNIGLIRSHLAQEAVQFRKGDFSDPAKIHGMDMPGVRELTAGASRVTVAYQPLDGGGRLTYTSTDPKLVTALHQWFDRQNADHSRPGMGGHGSHG